MNPLSPIRCDVGIFGVSVNRNNVGGLYGRDSELALITRTLERVGRRETSPAGAMIMLSGVSGAGKSALAEAVLETAEQMGYDCVRTACEPFHEGMSYFPVRELVRQMANGRPVGELVAEQFGSGSSEVEMAAVSESISADPASRREAIVATFTNVIMGEYRKAGSSPQLLFIDDLEHLDAGSADALICLVSRLSEGPVVILGAFRSDRVAEPTHPVRPVIVSARRMEGIYQNHEIRGFDVAGFGSLVESLLGGSAKLPDTVTRKLYEETEGNPLFTRELIRMLCSPDPRSGRVSLSQVDDVWLFDGDIGSWDIPDSVEEVIASRLNLLDVQERHELELAAVVGRRFAFAVLHGLMEAGEDELLRDMEKFLDVDLIRELQTSDESFEFSHGKIRDVLYAQLSGLRKRRLHAQVAGVISNLRASSNEDWDALIGEHLYLAAKHAEAFPYLLRAARNALAMGASAEAAVLYRKALESSDGVVFNGDDSRASIQLELVNAYIAASEVTNAGRLLAQLTGAANPSSIRTVALDLMGDVLMFEGEIDRALDAYQESRRLAEALDDTEALCEVLCDLAELHGRQYERQAGIAPEIAERHRVQYVAHVDEAFAMRADLAPGPLRARALRNKAKLSRVSGDLSAAENLYRQAIDTVDGRVASHRFLVPYAKTLRRAGKAQEALDHIERVISWSTQVGSARSQAIGWQYKATFLMTLAKDDESFSQANSTAERALHAHQSIGYAQGIRETEIVLGEIALRTGDLPRAIEWFTSAADARDLESNELLEVIAIELDANGEEDRAALIRESIEAEAATV
ncbi:MULTISPECIES: AAA family ATPase [unclassified Arthrobacter]|uniref:ATP-binding protein n=1 Tax=unclassified Arthrobacter TaxID=235627 RepID=UPI002883532A|nr:MULTISPECIES: AAA family ATPase [unclassified Arthrobacter]